MAWSSDTAVLMTWSTYHGPEIAGRGSNDCRGSRHVVHQCKFTKTARVVVRTDLLAAHEDIIHSATHTDGQAVLVAQWLGHRTLDRTLDQEVGDSTPGRGVIKSPRSTQPSIPEGHVN